jgi:hypothetical protein
MADVAVAHTIYLATDDGASVAAALVAMLVEQCHAVEGRPTRIGWWRPGAPGWTVLETFPPELLLDRPIGSREPRLVALARRLGCEAVYLGLHGSDVLLVEVDRRGRWAATGAGDLSQRDPDRLDRDDPRAGRDGTVPRFVLLEADAAMQAAIARSRSGAIRAIAKLWGAPKSPHPLEPGRDTGATPIVYSMSRGGGARVRHPKLGEGTILDEPPGDPPKLDVQFDEGRRMVLLARFVERIGR